MIQMPYHAAVVSLALILTFAACNFPATSASSIEVSTLNIFGYVKGGNPLPEFVDMTIKERTIDSIDINCPDDIWDNLINQSYPKLPYLMLDNYDRKGAYMRQKD